MSGHELRDIPRVLGRVRALARVLRQVFLGHAPHRLAKLLLLGGEAEIHGILRSAPVRSTPEEWKRAIEDQWLFPCLQLGISYAARDLTQFPCCLSRASSFPSLKAIA